MRLRIVTSSSAAVGCTAIVASRSAFVAPILIAIGEGLDHLAGLVAEDMRADHAVARRVDDELHDRALAAARERRLHRPEVGLVDVDDAVALDRLALGEADRADLRRREHRARDILVVDARRRRRRTDDRPAAWPSRIATGVRLMRLVTSPTAWIEGTLVVEPRRRRPRRPRRARRRPPRGPSPCGVGRAAGGDQDLIEPRVVAVGEFHFEPRAAP